MGEIETYRSRLIGHALGFEEGTEVRLILIVITEELSVIMGVGFVLP